MKGKKKDKPYSKDKFHYDPFKDEFTCPTGELLTRKGEYTLKKSGKRYTLITVPTARNAQFNWNAPNMRSIKDRSPATNMNQNCRKWPVKWKQKPGKDEIRKKRSIQSFHIIIR